MNSIKQYTNSFKLDSTFFYTLAVDAMLWGIILGVFLALFGYLQEKALVISGGMTPEALQSYLLGLPEDQLVVYASQLKWYVVQLIGALVLLPVFALMLYSLAQSIIWGIINDSEFKFRKHWKWNLENLAVLPLGLLMLLFFGLLRVIAFLMLPETRTTIFIVDILQAASIVLVLLWVLLAYAQFATHRKVFDSLRNAFFELKSHFRRLSWIWLLGFATLVVLRLLHLPFNEWLLLNPAAANVIDAGLFLLWFAWFRLYVVAGLPAKSTN